jgi:predicted regulator of Ras-like GTPase activity (Roadblock/LC7/MglB family)
MSEDRRSADAAAAERVLEQLRRRAPDLRDAAVLGADGGQLAATDDRDWSAPAAALWRAADGTEDGSATQVHVGTEDGEVIAVRAGHAMAIATTERFALASLLLCDLRDLLRELESRGVS